MKRAAVLVFRQTEEVLKIRVLQNLAKRLAVVGAKPFLDDESAEGDANRYRRTARKSRREAEVDFRDERQVGISMSTPKRVNG